MKRLLFITAFLPSIAFAQETYNPFESIGKTTEVVTLSNGRYKEVYGGDTVKRIGNVMFDVRTNKVVKFLAENDTTTGYELKKEGDIATRWLSIDPLAAKYPYLSPYVFVANNPVIYVDPDGRDNVIYLVVANDKNGKPSLDKTTANKIALEANKIYEKLGVATRVVVYDNKEPFNPKFMDKTDAVAVVGQTKQQVIDSYEKIDASFAQNLKEKDFANSKDNPESSQNKPGPEGGKFIAVGFEATKDFFNYENTDSPEKKTAFVITHGAGHNANFDHDQYGIMKSGFDIKWDRQTVDQMTKQGAINNDYVDAIKLRFGNSYAIPTYQNNQTKYNNYVEKHGEQKGEKLYESYQKSGTN